MHSTHACKSFPCTFLLSISSFSRLCDSRKYTYFFPSYLLIPPKPGSAFFRNIEQYNSTLPSGSVPPTCDFWTNLDLKTLTLEEELRHKRSWRVDSAHLERLRTTAKRYEGTHNFHNFTVARNPKDGTNKRYMKVIDVRPTVAQ